MVHFESVGKVLGTDFFYETVKIPYGSKKIRNYVVDLAFPEDKYLIEVKPSSRAENKNNRAKRAAAEKWCLENGWSYLIITEEEIRVCGEVLTLERASQLEHVVLNERAQRSLRKQRARIKRRKK